MTVILRTIPVAGNSPSQMTLTGQENLTEHHR